MAPKAATSSRWTDEEVAFVLNYADECLHDKKDFKDTIPEALLEHSGRETTASAISSKVNTYLKMCNPKVLLSDFTRLGVRCLDASVLTPKLLTAMRQQRPQHLGDLQFREAAESSSHAEGVVIGERKRSQKSYCEISATDSNASKEDPEEADYVNDSAQKDSKTPSGSNTLTVLQTNKHRNDHASTAVPTDPEITHSKAAGKRKASSSEVVDLSDDSDTAPPTKRTAHDNKLPATLKSSNARNTQAKAPRSHVSTGGPSKDISRDRHTSQTPAQSPKEATPEQISEGNVSRTQRFFWSNSHAVTGVSQESWQNRVDIEALQRQLNHLSSLVMFKMERDLTHEELSDDGIQAVLKAINLCAEENPAKMAKKLIVDAKCSRAARAHSLKILRDAFRRHDTGTTLIFPPIPHKQEVIRAWGDARQGIKDTFTDKLGYSAREPAINNVSAGYIACTIDRLLEEPTIRHDLIPSLGCHIEAPHAAQALISALFCRWLFATPDGMCEGYHSALQLMQHKTVALSDGLSEVQRLDKIAFSSLFADETFQETTMPPIMKEFFDRFDVIKQACPTAPGIKYLRGQAAWSEGVFKLKQQLMISPQDYRMHFCYPGTPFDSAWMTAEDDEGEFVHPNKIGSRTVRLCLFPALVEQDPKEFEENQPMEDALIKNKNFLTSWEDRKNFDAKRVVGKAAVLVA